MSEKRLAKDLKPGDVISFGGHYGPGDDIVKNVIKCSESVMIYTERGGEFSVSENTTFDFVGSERRCVMSELEQLRDDLKVIERYEGRMYALAAAKAEIGNKIAKLEAEAADPWRKAKESIDHWRSCGMWPDITGLYDHLTAEVDRLKKRVAELEAENAPIDPDGYQLGDFRVMKTAQEIARYAMDRNIDHPVIVKTARRAIWAIKEFVEQARHWNGLSKLQPYRWTSLGRDDKNFIDQDFDTTESPCDYDPDAHKPLSEMQPPFDGPIVGIEPVLDPASVLLTAMGILANEREFRVSASISDAMFRLGISANKPYKLKGAAND